MMEKGSFHPSSSQGTLVSSNPASTTAATKSPTSRPKTAEELVRGIPLPNQLPKSMDFHELPPSPFKSSTLETLISQNEDLMARLSVNLRKTNHLEERNAILERENSTFSAKFDTLREQFLVLKEKDRINTLRSHELLEESGSYKERAQKLEKLYSGLYVQAQALQRRLVRLERYRARMKKAAARVQERARRLPEVEDLYLQSRQAMTSSQTQIVNSYEAKLSEVKTELDSLRSKAGDRDQIFEQKLKLENALLHNQRQHQLRREETQTTIDRLEEENSKLRLEIKENLVARASEHEAFKNLSVEIPGLREQHQADREQIESLQALWTQKQKDLDQIDEKNRALQKLNQSLSVNLNQQRKEIHQLKAEGEKEQFQANEKIKTLIAEVQMLRRQMIEGA